MSLYDGRKQKHAVVYYPVMVTLIPLAAAGAASTFPTYLKKYMLAFKNDFALETSIVYINICFLWKINGKGLKTQFSTSKR